MKGLAMKSLLFLLIASFLLKLPSYSVEKDKYSTYSQVTIHLRSDGDIAAIQREGVDLDHYTVSSKEGIVVVINQDAIQKLQATGIPFTVTIADMDEYHHSRPIATESEMEQSRLILRENGIRDFRYGSMGGYLTYAEMVTQLDSMRLLFPSLITAKESLGVTEQGRVIWGAEISDNPGISEPGESVVHFDALHHAREPQSMATIMYYMYWLLDNYGTNPEATYLVNNRRICFVPVANPDGYFYNQQISPNGGGSWRKNRRNNGDGSYGVDLNRNYNYQWGYDNSGSSPTPSSDTYRGPAPLSEPESRAIRNYTMLKLPTIAMSAHSVAGRYLNPYSYKDTVVTYEYYAEFASDFSAYNDYLYGTVFQMLAYNSNGTTRDYLHHDLGCYAWTPEMGGSGFWPAQSEIVPIAQENLLACRYMTWISGGFADYHSFDLVGRPYALRGDTLRFTITVRNKGVSLTADNVNVTVQSLYAHASPIVASAAYGSIPSRQAAVSAIPFSFLISSSASTRDEMRFVAVTTQEGIETSRDTFSIVVGVPNVLFAENGEAGIGNWTRGGNGVQWDSTFVMAFRGSRSISDSRYGNVANSTNNTLTLTNAINLAGVANPTLEFFARWANERSFDYVRLQLSTNNGSTWINLAGRHTTTVGGQPSYTGNKGPWAWEQINLAPYAGEQVKLRFNLISDASLRGDGFYFDELRVVEYRDSVVNGVTDGPAIPLVFALEQNHPNPFNPATRIRFSLPASGHTTLVVYEVLGKAVATLVNEPLAAGRHEVTWDAADYSSGVYFYRLVSGKSSATRKLLLVR
jgi:carboxypeptidase T